MLCSAKFSITLQTEILPQKFQIFSNKLFFSSHLHVIQCCKSIVLFLWFFVTFKDNSENVDLSCRTDLDFFGCFGRKKHLIAKYIQYE